MIRYSTLYTPLIAFTLTVLCFAGPACVAMAGDPQSSVAADSKVADRGVGQMIALDELKLPGLIPMSTGVTRKGTSIPVVISTDDLDVHSPKLRVLLVGGLDGSRSTVAATVNVMKRFYSEAEFAPLRAQLALSAVLCGNPDGQTQQSSEKNSDTPVSNGSGGNPTHGYPPKGESYTSPTDPEAQYIWRWIGMHAPDIVIELVSGEKTGVIDAVTRPADSLSVQLAKAAPAGVGTVNAVAWSVAPGDKQPFAQVARGLLDHIQSGASLANASSFSAARLEMQHRADRTPLQVCEELSRVYGHDLATVAYIPAVACMGRVRYGAIIGDRTQLEDIERIVAPYRDGTKAALNEKSGGSEFAGQLLWGTLLDATRNKAYLPLALAAADRAFDADGKPLEAMPSHLEMSDSVFMGCPVLAQAGRLTGDDKYYQMCVRHMRFMTKLNVRADGLHRHSPLDESAWGRGNGFPALGLALTLSDFPESHPLRDEVLNTFRMHLKALLPHQDATGAWHQVVDHPESYRELTSTCMITFAMLRGVRRGWLSAEEYTPAIKRGWEAVKARVASDGTLVDVCTGTGKMKSLREYYDRTAILGRDGRGGAMALLVATEMAGFEKK